MDDLRQILAVREALYARADASFDTAGRTIDGAFSQLLQLIKKNLRQSAK